jgi:hypothetical protein
MISHTFPTKLRYFRDRSIDLKNVTIPKKLDSLSNSTNDGKTQIAIHVQIMSQSNQAQSEQTLAIQAIHETNHHILSQSDKKSPKRTQQIRG